MTVNLRVDTPNPELTLSAAPGHQPENVGGSADPELTLLRAGYAMRSALGHTHDGPCLLIELAATWHWPWTTVWTERDGPIITEAELRLLDGNR